MDGTLIDTTRNADLQMLGTGGQRAIQAWDQIVGYVRRTLGDEHAALFAEPNPDPDRGITDWYAAAEGEPTVLNALNESDREAATANLARLHGDISAASERLRRSAREDERFLGEMLALALIVPNADHIRVVGKQPILVAWGHTLVGAAMNPELLIGKISRTPMASRGPTEARPAGASAMRIVGPPARRTSNAWKYVLGALLLACLVLFLPLLLLLLDPLHWFRVTAAACVVSPSNVALLDELRSEAQRESTLRDQLARVALERGDRRTACPPRVVPAPSTDSNRAKDAGARSGKLQIILAWDDVDDLDLVVYCPNGQKIYFNEKSNCGGTLDIDQNRSELGATTTPVESIVFEAAPAPGTYRIVVLKYAHRLAAPARSAFRVTVRQDGMTDQVSSGTVGQGETVSVDPVVVPVTR